MTITQMIEKLNKIKSEEGDLECVYRSEDFNVPVEDIWEEDGQVIIG